MACSLSSRLLSAPRDVLDGACDISNDAATFSVTPHQEAGILVVDSLASLRSA